MDDAGPPSAAVPTLTAEARSAPEPEPPPPEAPRAEGPSGPVRAALLLAFVMTVSLGVMRVHDRVRGLQDFRVDLSRVRMLDRPPWLPDGERLEIERSLAASGALALDDPALPVAVAARVERDPRVAAVLGVRRLYPDGVEVLAALRRPVAEVRCAGGIRAAVDGEGVRLPGDPAGSLPVIRFGGGAPAAGERFPDGVREAASVLAALPAGAPARLGLLDVEPPPVARPDPGAAPDPGVRLHRPAGPGRPAVTVEWGRGPSAADARLDPPTDVKLARLRLAAERFPDLRAVDTVRLRFDDLVVLRR